MKVSDYIANFLSKKTHYVFGGQGGSVVHLVNSIDKHKRINFIPGQNEQASSMAADAYHRVSKKLGVAIATSGPGISLMSEFLGLAYFAEVPLVLFDVQRGGPSTGMPTRTQQSDILSCAYASHGDTKHVLLIPSNPKECFEFSATAFDLADQLQTPIIVLSDLDLGMNDWSTKQLEWNDSKNYNKGKVLSKEDLDELEDFGRYLDVDGDGIPYRTYPGTHPDKGAFFTRGTSHDEYARYTEDGKINAENLKRLVKKFSTASQFVPGPLFNQEENNSNLGVIYFGSTDVSMQEALDTLQDMDIQLDGMRIRAFPFNLEVWEFIEDHDLIFLVEQNRDGQMKTLIMAEGGISAEKLVSILCYDGQPITADLISSKIRDYLLSNSEQLAVSGK